MDPSFGSYALWTHLVLQGIISLVGRELLWSYSSKIVMTDCLSLITHLIKKEN